MGGLVVLSLGFGLFLYFFAADLDEDVNAFAQTTDKNGCLDETALRISECSGAMCLVSTTSFGLACMEEAPGNRNDYCVGKQAASSLPKNYCEPYQDSDYCAQVIAGAVNEYCNL